MCVMSASGRTDMKITSLDVKDLDRLKELFITCTKNSLKSAGHTERA